MSSTTSSSSGIGLTSLLAVLFIGLKLTKVITWSWWWVLAPVWSGAFIISGVLLLCLILAAATKTL